MKSSVVYKKTREHPTKTLVAAINKALKCVEARKLIPRSVFEDAQKSLDALPLPTAAYARYLCNIRNAESYVLRTEFGAARFELQMLLKSLRS